MPAFQLSPIGKTVQQAVPGLPAYCYGSLNRLVAPTRMNITNVALTTNVATLGVTVIEGNLPVVGQLVSVAGCSNSVFNTTTPLAITAVSFTNTPEDGKGTISFAQTHADVPSAAATGAAMAPQIEVGETIANGASIEIAIPANTPVPENGRAMLFDVYFPTLPTAVTVAVQGASIDDDNDFTTLGTIAVVSGGVLSGASNTGSNEISLYFDGVRANFIRFLTSGLTGSGKIVAKVVI